MNYVIKRSGDGAYYVAYQGNQSSYVRSLQHARTFATRESAERERCPENEYIVSAYDEMRPSS